MPIKIYFLTHVVLIQAFCKRRIICLCRTVDLANVLTSETLIPILANAEVREQMKPFLPSGESIPSTEEELRNTIQSPQFQQVGNNWYRFW